MKIQKIKPSDVEDLKTFIENNNSPIIISELFKDWPYVELAKDSPSHLLRKLLSIASKKLVDTLLIESKHKGLISYASEDYERFTFKKFQVPLKAVLKRLIVEKRDEHSEDIAVQSALIEQCLPSFLTQNPSPNFLSEISPRIWIGTATTVPGHYDTSHNIALNVCGKRTFYLLPPNAIPNIYVAPIDRTITGPAISLVDFEKPDLSKYPKFKNVHKDVQIAELEVGEALYIPPMWWHNVKSHERANILVNYWWENKTASELTSTESLIHAILTIRALPKYQRDAWKEVFKHYVFDRKEDVFDKTYKGILSNSQEEIRKVEDILLKRNAAK
ncbi:cupin-like domain-containing protein [Pseudoalteromonas maricaloris]|uniref:cupin-like domain-containing protein n=1 Tax=Pseudoalteromonas maricaloris TaxID=184924 RepID=UPI00029A2A68|nr:cupin-like domain-containing protein [Pseudoalteromonas flavipulchra]